MLAVAIAVGLAAAAPSQSSPQAIYNEAQAAYDKADWGAAATAFARITNPPGRDSLTDGLIRGRLATALMMLGRNDEAQAAAERTVQEIAAATPSGKSADLADAYVLLGDVLRQDLQMREALAAYDKGRAALLPDASSFPLDIGTIQAAMVLAPDRAAGAADAALARKDIVAKLARDQQALLLSLRGRAELNRGNAHGAADFITRATDEVGAFNGKVTSTQAQVRSDAALVYTMLRDVPKARLFLAYSGAGYMPSAGWLMHGDGEFPVCGDDVQPDDVAVVEMAISPDGSVEHAVPIYASRPGETGVVFARAVQSWHYEAADVAKLNAFWRGMVRLELRCVMRPAPQQMGETVKRAAEEWLHRTLGDYRQRSARAMPSPDPLARLRFLLGDYLTRGANGHEMERAGDIDSALVAAGAPAATRAWVARLLTGFGAGGDVARVARRRAAVLEMLIPRIAVQPDSAYAVAWLRTELALEDEAAGALDRARAQIDSVLATPEATLPERDPIRLVATLHRAFIEQRGGDAAAAEARLTKAGLDASQCSMFDIQPVAQNTAISNSIFPDEALKWGMQGVSRESFDIAADGSVKQVRTVLSYPPFVFGGPSEKAIARFRYLPPTIGNTPLSCNGKTLGINYVVPHG